MPTLYGMSGREFWRFWWRYIAGPGMWIVLALCVTQLGPTWSAHQNHGRIGTWTVTRIACSKGHCNDVGRFVSADGSDVRTEITISGGSSLSVGEGATAVDTGGDSVYPPGGGSAWLTYTVATTLLIALCAFWVWSFPVAVIRRHRAAQRKGLPVTDH